MAAQLAPPKIASIQYVLAFPEPVTRMRFLQQQIEEAFGLFMGVQSTQTNVPDNFDPNAPRVIFSKSKKHLFVSQTQCVLSLDFKESGLENSKIIDVGFGKIQEFNNLAFNAFPDYRFLHNALVVAVEQKGLAASAEIKDLVYEKFIKSPRIGPIASVEAKIGFEVSGHYVNLAASIYEERVAKIEQNQQAVINFFNIEKMELTGYGIGYTIDVNSRLRASSGQPLDREHGEKLMDIFTEFAKNSFQNFTGASLL